MDKYRFEQGELDAFERSCVPFAVYQFIDRRVMTLALSAGFCELFGFKTLEEAYYLMDHNMYRDTHPDDVARIAEAAVRFATEGGDYNVVYRSKVDGEYRIIHALGRHVQVSPELRLAYIWYTDEGACQPHNDERDTALSPALNAALRESSLYRRINYDYMTGLPSMSYFFELADAGIRRMQQSGIAPAMLYIDLNGMKFFNSKHGFAEGDKLIRAVAEQLVQAFSNESCSRLGQDHFGVFAPAEGLEEKLQELFAACEQANGARTLPLRVGVYLYGDEHTDVSTACDRAKYACDVNRRAYSSRFTTFDGSMLSAMRSQEYIIDNFDRALAEGWIKVYYQPIVRTANNRVSDEEALARWIEPGRDMISPQEFIPVLEDAMLIHKLDLYVLEQVLDKMKFQSLFGLYVVPTSLNLSRVDFSSCDIVEEIRRRVDEAGVPREKLTIELTESVIGSDFAFMKEQIARFRELGFKVWMDDFGSEYSSLDLLQNIRFDLIKFDSRFMQQFDQSDDGRVILAELMKLAIALGIDTVAEGVERTEQVDFLREIGCTKLQGYYFCRPLPPEEMIELNAKGTQIAFENPMETEYYSSIGKVNLYDLSSVTSNDVQVARNYFNTLPMAILEYRGIEVTVSRSNQSFRDFMQRFFGRQYIHFGEKDAPSAFVTALKHIGQHDDREIIDEILSDGTVVHSFVRRIATNPVTGTVAYCLAVLNLRDVGEQEMNITYAHIAQALSADYTSLYYVNLDTEQFIEYSFDAAHSNLAVERHGSGFFTASRKDALERIYKEDRAAFLAAFTKEIILAALNENGVFTLTYRLLNGGDPFYVNMKATRMKTEGNHIIIGVNNVDAQMRQQEALERMKEEELTYSRVTALSGDYICIYTVDPVTDRYVEYSATRDYESLGLDKQGEDFFGRTQRESTRAVYYEDQELMRTALTKESILQAIEQDGFFTSNYRLLINGAPQYVSLKAVMIEERDGPQLLIGVTNIDAQVKRDQEHAHDLSVARAMANVDALTGVKNKHAYVDLEAYLNRLIQDRTPVPFALTVLDVNDLKKVNDTQGHRAGDEYLRKACGEICNIFKHSPVFRVGGDEFAVISQGADYEHLEALITQLDAHNRESAHSGGVVIARGAARFQGDRSVAAVFERADVDMYENKKMLKSL